MKTRHHPSETRIKSCGLPPGLGYLGQQCDALLFPKDVASEQETVGPHGFDMLQSRAIIVDARGI